eukprot:TRINITY_DN5241_c1_g1_i2.p3 TRINITY_DN5241_c1_g1~~TRINITY_DN5241_c1_g1_i2.p3  ORF type:complete len:410 (+),score=38.45 TRINITY_DN5241_c1_g1_i2:178-1407(+)
MKLTILITFIGVGVALRQQFYTQLNNRHLLQSEQDLELLCSVKSNMRGAYILFNEELLRTLCDHSKEGCTDVPPVLTEGAEPYACAQVVSDGLCEDTYVLRGNYCARTCNRCTVDSCKTTISGCSCLDSWTTEGGGKQYSSCANPNNDPKGPWCKIDADSCSQQPSTTGMDYCDSACVSDDETGSDSGEEEECELFGAQCSNECEGEENIQQVMCYGLEPNERECVCVDPLQQLGLANVPVQDDLLPATKNQNTPNIIPEQNCYEFLPSKEGTCADRVRWNSCGEFWISEKFYCAISCGLCDEPLTQQYNCLPHFERCLQECGREDNIQEFACFREEEKFECVCSQANDLGRSVQGAVSERCSDFLPENEGTCAQRKEWGSCKEGWMREKNYCALTCGFCELPAGTVYR